jgi:hypothetical protein
MAGAGNGKEFGESLNEGKNNNLEIGHGTIIFFRTRGVT